MASNRERLLHKYELLHIAPSAVYCWLWKLGFKYKHRRKGYYVDGPEKPATIENKKQLQINTYHMRGEQTDESKSLYLKPPIWKKNI
jgi:hypothetical protein